MKKTILLLTAIVTFSCKQKEAEPFGKTAEPATETVAPEATPTETPETATAESPEALGKQIVEGKGNCFTCHNVDAKTVGPSIKEIAKTYQDKKGDMIAFLKGNADAIVDPSQFEVMKTNFAVTKAMSDEELKAIEAYFNSTLK